MLKLSYISSPPISVNILRFMNYFGGNSSHLSGLRVKSGMKMRDTELHLCRLDKRTDNCTVMLLRPWTWRWETTGKLLRARRTKKCFNLLSAALCLFCPSAAPVDVGCAHQPPCWDSLWRTGSRREGPGMCMWQKTKRWWQVQSWGLGTISWPCGPQLRMNSKEG